MDQPPQLHRERSVLWGERKTRQAEWLGGRRTLCVAVRGRPGQEPSNVLMDEQSEASKDRNGSNKWKKAADKK